MGERLLVKASLRVSKMLPLTRIVQVPGDEYRSQYAALPF